MTRPRMIMPGATYLVTRRCSERRFFLTPNEGTNHILRYCLAAASERFDVEVHAFLFMSNHVHLVLTDVKGELPDFMQYLSSLVARALNVLLGRRESLWSTEGYNQVRLVGRNAVLRKIAYTLANPVRDDLVGRHGHWPGVKSRVEDLGRVAFHVRRPEKFFRSDGPLPEGATLQLTLPPGVTDRDAFLARVETLVRHEETAAERRRERKGKRVMGRRALARQDPFAAPTTWEPFGRLKPLVACLDPDRRNEALHAISNFVRDYTEARDRWRDGARDVVFPLGTWGMRVRFGVPCAAPG